MLACSVRLLDVGMFRIGGEVYEKEDGHLGLATIAKTNVSIENGQAVFDYIAKEGVERVHAVADPCCVEIVGALKRRRGGGDHLLAFREGRAWHQVHAPLINAHLKSLIGDSFSAKNFRTWNGTLLAAVTLARCEQDCASERGRRHAIRQATTDVAQLLGNTPAVARGSYIDPRVFDRFLSGWTIAAELRRVEDRGLGEEERRTAVEAAVLDLLRGRSALEEVQQRLIHSSGRGPADVVRAVLDLHDLRVGDAARRAGAWPSTRTGRIRSAVP